MNEEERIRIDRMFKPRGIAFFGGISTPGAFGNLIALSQIRYGYKGKLYPISSKGGELAGYPVFKSLKEISGPIDLASISVPAQFVPSILKDCLRHGITGAQIHSSGFSELGTPEGIALQKEIMRIARQGIRIVGPNCFGIHCPSGRITLLPGHDFSKESGSIAMISQSGGVAANFCHEALFAGIRLSKVVSFGNGCDLNAIELMDYLADDPETGMIAAYLEGVEDGGKFLKVIHRASATKSVVIWKAGLTPLGDQAARSHTASIAGETRIWKGALRQAGAISVEGLDEIMDALLVLRYIKAPGKKIALVGGGGAIGVYSCDLAHGAGLDLPQFSAKTQNRLRKYYPTPGNSMKNPLDTGTPIISIDALRESFEIILTAESIDILIIVFLIRSLEVEVPTFMEMAGMPAGPSGIYLKEMLSAILEVKEKTGKDIVAVFDKHACSVADIEVEKTSRTMQQAYQEKGIPVFSSVLRALRGIRFTI